MISNSAISTWQLAIMAVVPVAALAAWLSAIFLAARGPRGRAQASAASPAEAAAPETLSAHDASAPMTGAGEPARPADGRIAA
jgi:hypothetical protein